MKQTKRNIGATIQLPEELANPLREIAGNIGMDPTNLVRAILRAKLPQFPAGKAAITNGEMVEIKQAA